MARPHPLLGEGTSQSIPEVEDLSNTERELLKMLAEPGGPLWKIFRSMLDYGDVLRDQLATADLFDEAQRAAATKVQATILAIDWVESVFESALTLVPEKGKFSDAQ